MRPHPGTWAGQGGAVVVRGSSVRLRAGTEAMAAPRKTSSRRASQSQRLPPRGQMLRSLPLLGRSPTSSAIVPTMDSVAGADHWS